MFPTDMRYDYLTTDQTWVMARDYIKNNKSAIESAFASESKGNGGVYYWDKNKSISAGEDPRGAIPRHLYSG